MVDNLVAKPASKKSEQITSASTASVSEVVASRPITEMNWMGSPENSFCNLGIPWVNISAANPILAMSRPRSVVGVALLTIKIFLIKSFFASAQSYGPYAAGSIAFEQEKALIKVKG